jgi:hypothetical protein
VVDGEAVSEAVAFLSRVIVGFLSVAAFIVNLLQVCQIDKIILYSLAKNVQNFIAVLQLFAGLMQVCG